MYRTDNPQDLKKDFFSYAGVHGRNSSYVTEVLRSEDSTMIDTLMKVRRLPLDQLVIRHPHGPMENCHDDAGRNMLHFVANDSGGKYNMWLRSLVRCKIEFASLAIGKDFAGRRPYHLATASGNQELLELLKKTPAVILAEFFDATSGPTRWLNKEGWLDARKLFSYLHEWHGYHFSYLKLKKNGLRGGCSNIYCVVL